MERVNTSSSSETQCRYHSTRTKRELYFFLFSEAVAKSSAVFLIRGSQILTGSKTPSPSFTNFQGGGGGGGQAMTLPLSICICHFLVMKAALFSCSKQASTIILFMSMHMALSNSTMGGGGGALFY